MKIPKLRDKNAWFLDMKILGFSKILNIRNENPLYPEMEIYCILYTDFQKFLIPRIRFPDTQKWEILDFQKSLIPGAENPQIS